MVQSGHCRLQVALVGAQLGKGRELLGRRWNGEGMPPPL